MVLTQLGPRGRLGEEKTLAAEEDSIKRGKDNRRLNQLEKGRKEPALGNRDAGRKNRQKDCFKIEPRVGKKSYNSSLGMFRRERAHDTSESEVKGKKPLKMLTIIID